MLSIWMLAAIAPPETPPAPQVPVPVHVAGRVVHDPDGALRFGWPGVYFEGRFRGDAVTVAVASGTEHLRVLVDGHEKAILLRPGTASLTLKGLAAGEHVVRLEKQTESQTGGGRFLGFFLDVGSEALPPAPRARQIEFIGDSYTVGYGNLSPGRTCTREEVHDRTDTQRAFGPLLAKRLDADYRINAFSGFGIVRNYAGGAPGLDLPAIYPRLLPDDPALVEGASGRWRPQLIVINLGTNDFSTELKPGERWADAAALRAAWRERYGAFVRGLVERQPQARLILMGSDAFYADLQQVAKDLPSAQAAKVTTLRFGELDLMGCDWHPSLADHLALADRLEAAIRALPSPWNGI